MSKLSSIEKGPHLAGARLGDLIDVRMITGGNYILIFTALNQFGIEGHLGSSVNGPILFIPFTSIICVNKVVPIELEAKSDKS